MIEESDMRPLCIPNASTQERKETLTKPIKRAVIVEKEKKSFDFESQHREATNV